MRPCSRPAPSPARPAGAASSCRAPAFARRRPAAARAGSAPARRGPVTVALSRERDGDSPRRLDLSRRRPGAAARRWCRGCARCSRAPHRHGRRRAARSPPGALRPLRRGDPRRPPPPARPGRAPDRLRVRELLGDPLRRPRLRPVGQRTLWLEDFELPDEVWAAFRIPIGLAFFMHSSVTDCVVALYPSPAGATESELHFEAWGELRALNPVLERAGAGRRGADRQPPVRSARSTRSRRSTAATCSWGSIKSRWEGISGGAGVDEAVAGFFDELRARRACRHDHAIASAADPGAPRRPSPRSRCSAPSRAPLRGGADARLRPARVRAGRPAVYTIALSVAGDDRARAARLRRRDARAAGGAVRPARALGARPRAACCGRRSTCSCRPSPAPPRSACRSPAATTSSSRRPSTSTPLRGRRGAAGVQLQRHDLLPRRRRPAADGARARGAARPSTGCRSRPGAS